MSRFLFVVPPLVGHVNPTISVARALMANAHEVAWVAHPRRVKPLLPDGAKLIALDDGASDEVFQPVLQRARSVRGLESLRFLWEDVLVPLARSMYDGVLAALRSFAPDVVIVDQQAIGGALAARKYGARWATFCTTSASVVDPLSDLPKVKQWVLTQLESLQGYAGLPLISDPDLSPERVIIFSTQALVGERTFPAHYHFVGPSIADRPENSAFPFEWLQKAPSILVSLGTVNRDIGTAFYKAVVEAFRNEPLQVVLVASPEQVPSPPPNILVREHVPQLALMPHMQAVVCHAGHNTVCEALAHALPLVVAPIRDDQPVVAGQVTHAGAGVRLKFGRVTSTGLRSAVFTALSDSKMRAAAQRIQSSFAAAGGARAAARLLEEMA